MRILSATLGLLLSAAALAQTPLSPPAMPTQPQLAPQTPLAPRPQPSSPSQGTLVPETPGPSLNQPQLPAEKPLPQTPQLGQPAAPQQAPLGPGTDGGPTVPAGMASPAPQKGAGVRLDGGP